MEVLFPPIQIVIDLALSIYHVRKLLAFGILLSCLPGCFREFWMRFSRDDMSLLFSFGSGRLACLEDVVTKVQQCFRGGVAMPQYGDSDEKVSNRLPEKRPA